MDYDYNIFFRIRDYIANCSITVEMLKKLIWKYFNKHKRQIKRAY